MIKVVQQGNAWRIERHRDGNKTEIYTRDGKWGVNYNWTAFFATKEEAQRRAQFLARHEVR